MATSTKRKLNFGFSAVKLKSNSTGRVSEGGIVAPGVKSKLTTSPSTACKFSGVSTPITVQKSKNENTGFESLKTKLHDLKHKNAQKQKDMDTMRSQTKTIQIEVARLKSELCQKQGLVIRCQTIENEQHSTIERLQLQYQDLLNESEQLNRSISQCGEYLNDFTRMFERCWEYLTRVTDFCQVLEQQEKSKEESVQHLELQIEEIDKELVVRSKTLQDESEKKTFLNRSIEDLNKLKQSLHDQCEIADKECTSKAQDLAELRNSNAELQNVWVRAQELSPFPPEIIESSIIMAHDYKNALDTINKNNINQADSLKEMEGNIQSCKLACSTLKMEISSLDNDKRSLQINFDRLSKLLIDSGNEHGQAKKCRTKLEEDIKVKSEHLAQLKVCAEKARDEIIELDEQVFEAEKNRMRSKLKLEVEEQKLRDVSGIDTGECTVDAVSVIDFLNEKLRFKRDELQSLKETIEVKNKKAQEVKRTQAEIDKSLDSQISELDHELSELCKSNSLSLEKLNSETLQIDEKIQTLNTENHRARELSCELKSEIASITGKIAENQSRSEFTEEFLSEIRRQDSINSLEYSQLKQEIKSVKELVKYEEDLYNHKNSGYLRQRSRVHKTKKPRESKSSVNRSRKQKLKQPAKVNSRIRATKAVSRDLEITRPNDNDIFGECSSEHPAVPCKISSNSAPLVQSISASVDRVHGRTKEKTSPEEKQSQARSSKSKWRLKRDSIGHRSRARTRSPSSDDAALDIFEFKA